MSPIRETITPDSRHGGYVYQCETYVGRYRFFVRTWVATPEPTPYRAHTARHLLEEACHDRTTTLGTLAGY